MRWYCGVTQVLTARGDAGNMPLHMPKSTCALTHLSTHLAAFRGSCLSVYDYVIPKASQGQTSAPALGHD